MGKISEIDTLSQSIRPLLEHARLSHIPRHFFVAGRGESAIHREISKQSE